MGKVGGGEGAAQVRDRAWTERSRGRSSETAIEAAAGEGEEFVWLGRKRIREDKRFDGHGRVRFY